MTTDKTTLLGDDEPLTRPMPTMPLPTMPLLTTPMPAASGRISESTPDRAQRPGHPGDGWVDEDTWLTEDITPSNVLESIALLDQTQPPDSVKIIHFDHAVEPCSGTSAVVYAGLTEDGTAVAVKIFRGSGVDVTVAEHVQKEWRAAQADYGPHVVRALACLRIAAPTGNRSYWAIVMNRVAGPTLKKVLNDVNAKKEIDDDTQLRWLRTGLMGLVALAERGHQLRDIKPQNIGLTSEDNRRAEPIFLDHGVAKRADTKTLVWAGTASYAAPEYLSGDRDRLMDRVDVFSFGASLIDVFTGGHGFEDSDPDLRTLNARPRLDDRRLAPGAARILRGTLVKNPEARPSAAELLALLDDPTALPDWDADTPYKRASANNSVTPDAAAGEGRNSADPLPTVPLAPDATATKTLEPNEVFDLDVGLSNRPSPVRVQPPQAPAPGAKTATLLPLTEDLAALEMRTETPPIRRRWLERFAGVDPRYVTARTDRTMYTLLGLLLVVYAFYAVAAVTVLTRMVMESGDTVPNSVTVTGILIGISVATVVISLDRSIVATSYADLDNIDDAAKDDQPLRPHLPGSIWVRIVFAILFAFFVGEAVNQAIFAKDIVAHLAERASTSLEGRTAQIRADSAPAIKIETTEISVAKQAIDKYAASIAEQFTFAEGERKGTFGTGNTGCGSQCLGYLNTGQTLQAGQIAFNQQQQQVIDDANGRTRLIEAGIDKKITEARAKLAQNTGLIAREKALWAMLLEDPWMLIKYIVLTTLFLLLELAAVMIKLSTRGNNYERDLARALRHRERVDRLRTTSLNNLSHRRAQANDVLIAEADQQFYRRQ